MNSHRQGNNNLARSSYSGSFKVMHLGPLKSRRRAVYIALYILYIMSIVSVHIASNKRWKLRSSTTHSHLTPLTKEPSRISLKYLIFLETRIIDLHFPADSWCLSSFNFFGAGRRNFPQDFSISISAFQGHPRSLPLVPVESAYATSY